MSDVGQDELLMYLESLEVYKLANVVKKGRELGKEVTAVEKGENGFLSDRIVLVPGDDRERKKSKVVRSMSPIVKLNTFLTGLHHCNAKQS